MNNLVYFYTVEYCENGEWYIVSEVPLETAILFIRDQQQKWENSGNIIKAAEFEKSVVLTAIGYVDEEDCRSGRPWKEFEVWRGDETGYEGLDDAIMDFTFSEKS